MKSQAIHLGTLAFMTLVEAPCGCPASWERYRVGNLDVRECRKCAATWTERHRKEKPNQRIF